MVESLNYVYSSEAEVKRILTTAGFTDYTTDDRTVADVVADAVNMATDEVNIYCFKWYAESDLANNSFVRRLATWIACNYLTADRGDEPRYQEQYNRAIEFLKDIESGKKQLPRCPQRGDLAPCMSNYVIDDRFKKSKVRVQSETSTGPAHSQQKQDITFDPLW